MILVELSYSLFSFAVEAVEGRVERKDMGGGVGNTKHNDAK